MIIKLAFAFGAGFISFLTPCVLPIIPGYISYITGKNLTEIDQDKKIVLIKTILFSLGFSLVFIALGVSASAVGSVLLFFSNELRIAAGIIIILFVTVLQKNTDVFECQEYQTLDGNMQTLDLSIVCRELTQPYQRGVGT